MYIDIEPDVLLRGTLKPTAAWCGRTMGGKCIAQTLAMEDFMTEEAMDLESIWHCRKTVKLNISNSDQDPEIIVVSIDFREESEHCSVLCVGWRHATSVRWG